MDEDDKIVKAFKMLIDQAHESQNDFLIQLMREHELGSHHQFIEVEIDRRARNQMIADKLKGNIIFWLFTGATASAGWWIWKHIKW